MSDPVRPRIVVHRGIVDASAILVDEALAGPLRARRRVVAAWVPGAVVHRMGAAILVRFPSPRLVDCAHAAGLPLVRVGTAASAPLASAPLAPDELAAIAPPPGAIVLVQAGAAKLVVPARADVEDPSAYLNLSAFAPAFVEPLGPPPARALVVAAPALVSAREVLGVAPAPDELARVIAALRARRDGGDTGEALDEAAPARRRFAFLARLASMIAAIVARFSSPRAGASGASGSRRALAAVPQGPVSPTMLDRVTAAIRNWIAAVAVHARLAPLIGRRQADYLLRMIDMFDRGDLSEALRHAVPLTEEQSSGGLVAPALGVPAPRSGLDISLGRRGGVGSALLTTGDFYAEMRAKYRAAFERLEREGRIDEAAFVLAELLRESAEAVSFLERHGRLHLAAELAEARSLPPGVLVRQWLLAGEVGRAVRIARRHGAFADALARLEKHEKGPVLRLLWAETLAEAGDFAAAVETAWPVDRARGLCEAWIEAAIARGGAGAARMLARKVALLPEAFAEVRGKVLEICEDGGSGLPAERRALADALLGGEATREARTLARPLIRALVRDGARASSAATGAVVKRLVTFSGDDAIRADLPAWPTVDRTPLDAVGVPWRVEVDAADTGPTAAMDVALLPGGRVALALGEAGVRVLARDGRTLFHLDQPAHRLVISDHGDRAIALAPRGTCIHRLARLDFAGRRAEAWCEARIGAFARDFDGEQWVVTEGAEILVVDALEARFEALASIPAPRPVVVIGRSATGCGLVCASRDDGWSRHRFDLPSWTRRAGSTMRAEPDTGFTVGAIGGDGGAALGWETHTGAVQLTSASDGAAGRSSLLSRGPCRPISLHVHGTWIAALVIRAEGVEATLLDVALVPRLVVALGGARAAAARLSDKTLAVADDRGRVIVIDLVHGDVVLDLRV